MKKLTRGLALAAAASLIALTGCSEARTDSQQQAIRYSGGTTDVEKFKNCQAEPKLDYGSPGDHVYYYPSGQRTFTFTDDPKAQRETDPISVTTKDTQQMTIRGLITFQMTTDCSKLQRFHELIGKRMAADFEQGKTEDEGWSAFLAQYMTIPVNSIADSIGLKYPWRQFYTDAAVQAQFEQGMKDNLGAAINAQIGEGVITINGVDIQRPEPSKELGDALKKVEQARADGQAEVEKVRAQRTVQAENNKLAADEVEGARQCMKAFTKEQCLIKDLARDGKITFYPIPQGGNVNINPPTAK